MAYELNAIESFKDRKSAKGKEYLSVKILGRGWASCWDRAFWSILKRSATDGVEIKIDIQESEKTDDQGNPYLNIVGAVDPSAEGGETAEAQEEGGEEAPPPRKAPPAKPPAPKPPAPAPRPAAGPAQGPAPAPAAGRGSDDSLGRAFVALAAGMLAWGGVIAKTEADVCSWIRKFENFRVKGIVPDEEGK